MDCYNPVNYSLQSRRRRSVFLFIYLFFFFLGGGGGGNGKEILFTLMSFSLSII